MHTDAQAEGREEALYWENMHVVDVQRAGVNGEFNGPEECG